MAAIDPMNELFDADTPPASPSQENQTKSKKDENLLQVTVTDPQQHGEGRSRYTTYRVDVRPPGDAYKDPLSTVRRRYSDFQWLYNRLHVERPGAIIPIIPHERAVQQSKRFSDELVAERRAHLERFLRRVQVHPELEGSPCLAAFFRADSEMFEAAKRDNSAPDAGVNPNSEKSSLLGSAGGAPGGTKEKIKHMFVKTATKLSVNMRGAELEETPDGPAFEEVDQYVQNLDVQVKSLAKSSHELVKGAKDSATSLHELGQTLFGVGQNYQPSGVGEIRPTLKTISNVVAALSALASVRSEGEKTKFDEPMKELERSVQAAKLAVRRRVERQLTYTTWLQQIKNRQHAVDRLRMNPKPGQEERIAKAQAELGAAEQGAKGAREELDATTQRVFREIERFKVSFHGELRQSLLSYAEIQQEYNKKMEDEWTKLVPMANLNNGPTPEKEEEAMISSF